MEKENVNSESLPEVPQQEAQVVSQETPETPTTQETVETPVAQEGQIEQPEAVDEYGVPYKNRYMEYKRKSEELSNQLPNIIEQKLKEVLPTLQQAQQPQERQYTIAELESFALQNPEYKPWVEERKAELIQKQLASQFDAKLRQVKEQEQAVIRRQQSEAYVAQNYPDMFIKDGTGRIVTWDSQHPMTKEVFTVLQDPDLKNRPDALQIASDLAYARYARSQQSKVQKTIKTAKSQVKTLEKKVMTEGAGRQPVASKTGFQKASERLAQTGRVSDAKEAVAEYLKTVGIFGSNQE